MDSNTLVVAALGRPFTLGMLYDARKDELIPGVTLWDDKILEDTEENIQRGSEFKITASDSIESKSSLLDVDASLKASFMGGLIEVGGSAKYLNDKKKFQNQSRVTFQYKATTKFKQLSMTHAEAKNTKQIDDSVNSLATHVVTGILYGANAFFVFDSEKVDASSVQSIQGSMEAVIKKIPSFQLEGRVSIELTEDEKALTDKFSCKFYGDFILESNPSKFEDTVKTYQQLPKLLGGKGENSVPLKVWMMPLKNLTSQAGKVVTEVSVGLVRKAQEALEDMRQLERRCNDCMEDEVATLFPHIHEKLSSFQKLCNFYAGELQESLAKTLPKIRAGKEDESSLKKIFEDRTKSPFSHENLSRWMDNTEREMNIIKSCVALMEGTTVARNRAELDKGVHAADVEDALCFVFTSLETSDPYLQEMGNYLDSFKVKSAVVANTPKQDQWYFSDEVVTKLRQKAKDFHDVSKALKNSSRFRFLIAAIANEKHQGASIYHYKKAILVSDDFSKPHITNVETVTNRRDLIWYACDLTLDPDTAHCWLRVTEGDKKATNGEWQTLPDLPQRFDHFLQVLCRESLTGCRYWEVEWSTGGSEDVALGVCYKGLARKGDQDWCRLGFNDMSWCLGHRWSPPSTPTLYADKDRHCQNIALPSTGCTRLGLYLDWSAGTLSYYNVSSDTLSHIHTFRIRFTEPVYPAFMIWRTNNYVFLPQM
ncbi:stonustoxin subunit beta-like [Toxotes jaculatrix]|uniref:stonustoxin subunit beta-like n=1 Tax=Toxotes jaculatrix TaxID=941984 RepID=UPI001B3AFAAF|nr:stonustoxin subunit beta-like [Toxotes jaculatrix]